MFSGDVINTPPWQDTPRPAAKRIHSDCECETSCSVDLAQRPGAGLGDRLFRGDERTAARRRQRREPAGPGHGDLGHQPGRAGRYDIPARRRLPGHLHQRPARLDEQPRHVERLSRRARHHRRQRQWQRHDRGEHFHHPHQWRMVHLPRFRGHLFLHEPPGPQPCWQPDQRVASITHLRGARVFLASASRAMRTSASSATSR